MQPIISLPSNRLLAHFLHLNQFSDLSCDLTSCLLSLEISRIDLNEVFYIHDLDRMTSSLESLLNSTLFMLRFDSNHIYGKVL